MSGLPGDRGIATATEEPVVVLRVTDLTVVFHTMQGDLYAVNGVSFEVEAGQTVAIVGESGSGKSVTMQSALGLAPPPPGATVSGRAEFMGRDLLSLRGARLRAVRGTGIGLVFQDPMSALNPVLTIGRQIIETLRVHNRSLSRSEARVRSVELLRLVGVPQPDVRLRQYSSEFSGGMRQRVMVALAIANDPRLVIADEPTTALDVTIQAQILDVLGTVRRHSGAAMVLITHDLGVVAETADRVVVMYGGTVVEQADVVDLFERPRHPYTVGLLASQPRIERSAERLPSIPGSPPQLRSPLIGCPFRDRCAIGHDRELCAEQRPPLIPIGPRHTVACHYSDEVPAFAAAVGAVAEETTA